MSKKVAFIGPKVLHGPISELELSWDFQTPMTSVAEFAEALENGTISDETSVIIMFSRTYAEDPDAFATYAAYLSPHAAICILTPDADMPSVRPEIEAAIKNKQIQYAESGEMEINPETPFFFVAYESPRADLFEAMTNYLKSPYGGESAKANIRTMLPSTYLSSIEEEFEEISDSSESDEFEIPKADPNANGTVIAVTSSKGGSGKSTVSMILSTYIAKASQAAYEKGLEEKPLKVVVVDLDVRDGQLGFLNGKMSPTIFNIVSESGDVITDGAVKAGVYSSPNLGCDFIFAAKRPRHAKNIEAGFYASLIHKLRGMYDIIILDTSVNYLDELLEKVAYPMADKILFVTDMGVSSIFGMARWLKETTSPIEAGGSGIDAEKIGIVVNKVMKDVEMEPDRIQKAASGRDIVALLPSAPRLFTYAANTNSMDQVLNKRQVNSAFRMLAEGVVGPSGYTLGTIPYIEE